MRYILGMRSKPVRMIAGTKLVALNACSSYISEGIQGGMLEYWIKEGEVVQFCEFVGQCYRTNVGDIMRVINARGAVQDVLTSEFKILELSCECGSAKVGSPRHSGWCPKYE
jgi:hypothetical protein